MDFDTSTYLILEKTKMGTVRIEAGRRATKYEEETKQLSKNKIIRECWREIDAQQGENI